MLITNMSEKERIILRNPFDPLYAEREIVPLNDRDSRSLHLLAEALSEGDSDAWGELYKRFYDSVRRFVAHVIRSEEDAADIAQETFVYLWQNHRNVNPDKSIKGYIYAIARTLAFRFLRRRILIGEGASPLRLNELAVEEITPDDIVVEQETDILITTALENLQPRRRMIFRMSRHEGMSVDQIARELKLSRRTVENQLYRATKQLREILFAE